jgi:hypothetical protein
VRLLQLPLLFKKLFLLITLQELEGLSRLPTTFIGSFILLEMTLGFDPRVCLSMKLQLYQFRSSFGSIELLHPLQF